MKDFPEKRKKNQIWTEKKNQKDSTVITTSI